MKINTRRNIRNYTSRTLELDPVLESLTRQYCADNCPRGKNGCCTSHHYKNEILEEMLVLQEREAKKNKWEKGKGGKCKYHNPTGCTLKAYKPPICIGHLCNDLEDFMEKEFGNKGKQFTEAMDKASAGSLDLGQKKANLLFAYLDRAIETGRKLVEVKKKNGNN